MSDIQQSTLLEEPRAIDVVAIERELTQLWKRATDESDDARAPVVRACALNLVVLTDDVARLRPVERLVGDVTLEHPARIFLIHADRSGQRPSLDAWISARCSVPVPGEKQVCCEQITLRGVGGECEKIPSVVASLLVPDVPSVLLWKAGIGDDGTLMPELAELVDRVLIDSSDEPEPVTLLLSWGAFVVSRHAQVLSGDLAWTHLTAWRSAMAQTFGPDETRLLLGEIGSVAVTVSTSTSPVHSGTSQAFLLLAWLSDRLHWSVVSGMSGDAVRGFSVSFSSASGTVAGSVRVGDAALPGPGGIEEMTLTTRSGVEISLASGEGRSCIRSEIRPPNGAATSGVLWARDRDETAVVAQELEILDRDPIYMAALDVLQILLGGAR